MARFADYRVLARVLSTFKPPRQFAAWIYLKLSHSQPALRVTMTNHLTDGPPDCAQRLPARLAAHQVAKVLGMQPEDIPILVRARLLRPLGSPPANGSKFYAACRVVEHAHDEKWLARASDAIVRHHHDRNHGE